jgi:capsular exopolysaccharide synthesis family protein
MPLLIEEEEKTRELLASRIRELESRDAILAQSEQQLIQQVKQLSVISRQYGDIQLEIKISSDNLNQFLTKREALRIDAGQRKIPWQILTPLNTPVRSTSDVRRNGALGGILGLLLGIGIALLLDKLSNVLRTSDEVKDIVKLPILGVIPFVILDDYQDEFFTNPNRALKKNKDKGFISHLKKIMYQILLMNPFQKESKEEIIPKYPYHIKSIFLEEFRTLYTNIRLLSPDDEIRSIVISSSVMDEGKSTTSTYLAQAAAALGKRVLLVDADLRRPSLHDKLELTNTLGLCNLISTNLSFDQVIQKSPLEPNLSILTSGQIPPDPSRLLSSQKMQSLMNLFSETYDLVIYDTPPLLGIVDAKLIAAKTDGIIMVVGLDKTRASILTQAMDLLNSSPITVFGLIANGAKDHAASLNRIYTRF